MILLNGERFSAWGKVLMLCPFGARSDFAKKYEDYEVRKSEWRDWVWNEVDWSLEFYFNGEQSLLS